MANTPVGVIPGFGGATKQTGSAPSLSTIKFNDPKLQAMFDQALAYVNSTPKPTGGANTDFLAGLSQSLPAENGKGIGLSESPLDARKLEISAGGMLAQAGGQQQHKSPGLFSRITDLLSRPMYTMASGIQQAGENLATHGFSPNVFANFAEGAAHGLAGTNKEDFGQLLQEKIDVDKVKKDHPDWNNQQVLDEVRRNPGQGHNPLFTGLGGLVLDITMDPTTLLNPGKVVKIGSTGEQLAKTVKAAQKIEDLGITSKEDALARLGGRISDSGPSLVYNSGDLKKTKELLTPANKVLSEQAAAPMIDEAARRIGSAGGNPDKLAAHLNEILHANLNPEVQRRLALGIGAKHLGSFSVEPLAKHVQQVTHGDNVIGKAVDWWAEHFQSSKGVHPLMQHIKLAAMGNAQNFNRAVLHNMREIWGKTSYDTRSRVTEAIRQGVKTLPVEGGHSTNLLDHANAEIQRIQNSVGEGKTIQSLGEVNRFLDDKFKLDDKLLKPGLKTPKDWLEQTIKETYAGRRTPNGRTYKDLNDIGHILWAVDHATNQAIARKSMWESIGSVFGHDPRAATVVAGNKQGLKSFSVRNLKTSDGRAYRTTRVDPRKPNQALPYLKGKVFHPDIADALERMHSTIHSPKAIDFYLQKYYDPALHAFKSIVTKYNPGFHERNLYGELMAAWFAGVKDPTVYKQAAQIMGSWGKDLVPEATTQLGKGRSATRAANILAGDSAQRAAYRQGGKTITLKRAVILPSGIKTNKVPVDVLMHLYMENGLKTGWYSEFDHALGASSNIAHQAGSKVNQMVQHLTEGTEDFARLGHFIDALNKSGERHLAVAATGAAQEVRKYHFDYTDFTHFEKQWMQRIFPFYKWTRKNIPLMMEMLFTRPGKAMLIPKSENALSRLMGYTGNNGNDFLPNGDAILPDWLRTDSAVPVGMSPSGNTRYMDAPIPFKQAFQTLGDPIGTAVQMASPVKDLIELAQGRKIRGGPISSVPQYLSGQTPYTNLLYQLMHGSTNSPQPFSMNNTKLIQFLTGLGIQENTPKLMQSQAKRDQQVASAKRKQFKQKQGTFISTNHPGIK